MKILGSAFAFAFCICICILHLHLHYLNFPPTFLDSIGVWGGFVTTVAHGAALSLLWGGFFEKVITGVPLALNQ